MTLLPWLAGNNGTHGKVCLNTGCQLTIGFDCKWHNACSLPSQRMHNNCSWLCHFWWNQDLLIAAIVTSHCNDFFVWVCPVNVLCRPVIWYTLWLRQTCQQLPKDNLCQWHYTGKNAPYTWWQVLYFCRTGSVERPAGWPALCPATKCF